MGWEAVGGGGWGYLAILFNGGHWEPFLLSPGLHLSLQDNSNSLI